MGALDAFDELLVRVERGAAATMLVAMGSFVFLDVAHRVAVRDDSLLGNPLVTGGVAVVVAMLAFRTRGHPGWAVRGLVVGAALTGAQEAFVRLVPNGLVWSQTAALALTLWLGTIGASLAAYERRHLALDVGSKLWPPAVAPKVAALGHLVTAAFCVGLLWLGWRSLFGYTADGSFVGGHVQAWAESDGAAGVLPGTVLPKWLAVAAIPYGMASLCFRFCLEAYRTWTGRITLDGGDDTLHQLGIEAPVDGAPTPGAPTTGARSQA
jgi:TRAP-type C4-dicarboxylate transport system permease small subunit